MRLRLSRLLLSAFAFALLCLGWHLIRLHHTGNKPDIVAGESINRAVVASDTLVNKAAIVNMSKVVSKAAIDDVGRRPSEAKFGARLIPRILHQTWISNSIPATYVPFVRSWIDHSPPLSYYYWTDAKSLEFVAKHYPHLLAMFKGYKMHLNRADAIRYMLLHHYGGIYADMDMMRLKNLAPLLNSSQELCYLSQERYEITRLYWGLNSSVMNAIMLSSPGHKFMEFVVNALPRYANQSPNVMESTGPFFLQNVYNDFMKSPPCNLSEATCRCVVADPYMFMPQIDPIRIPMFRSKCSNSGGLAQNARQACDMLNKIHWQNGISEIGKNSYTHHGFLHYGFENQRLRFSSVADIGSLRKDKLTFGTDFL